MKHAPKVPKQRILTAALLLALAHPAYAQQATEADKDKAAAASTAQDADAKKDPDIKDVEKVVVTGIRYSIESSVSKKRESNSVTENITAEDIGKLPDQSVAESLARLPGLTGQRGADGRVNVISIRGLSPAFSGALLNGREIVSSNDGRAVEYDQFPSELIGAATVYKTPNAALIGQGLSGTVDLMARGRSTATVARWRSMRASRTTRTAPRCPASPAPSASASAPRTSTSSPTTPSAWRSASRTWKRPPSCA